MTEEKEREEGRQTIFFTPLDSFNSDADESSYRYQETEEGELSNSLKT